MEGLLGNCPCWLIPDGAWSNNNPKPVRAEDVIADCYGAMLGAIVPAHVAHLGKQYGFRRARAWETPNAYRQSLVCFLVRRTLSR